MHVVRHDHVSHQQKLIPLANLSQCVHEYVLRANRPQQGQPPVTAEGEKVKIAAAVVTLELLGHKPASKTLRVTPTRGAPLSRICEKTRWHRHSCLCALGKSNKFSFGEATYRCQIAPFWVFSQLPLLGAVKCRGGILQSMLAVKREDRRGARATRPNLNDILKRFETDDDQRSRKGRTMQV